MPTVELVYDSDCPNVEAARNHLQAAHTKAGLSPTWQEWDREAEDSPAFVRGYGSPTILVNGQDVAGIPPLADANCCRVYETPNDGMSGVPSVKTIVAALLNPKEVE